MQTKITLDDYKLDYHMWITTKLSTVENDMESDKFKPEVVSRIIEDRHIGSIHDINQKNEQSRSWVERKEQ